MSWRLLAQQMVSIANVCRGTPNHSFCAVYRRTRPIFEYATPIYKDCANDDVNDQEIMTIAVGEPLRLVRHNGSCSQGGHKEWN